MPKSEDILIKEKINDLRQLLREYVSKGDLIQAINNREIIKILYKGEDTEKVGWRTVEPYVLGTSKAGNVVLRGWQQAGDSDGFSGIGRTPRQGHERWNNYHDKGPAIVPGWRLFRLDGIKQMVFTKSHYDVDTKNIAPDYNPSDDGMTSVMASAMPVGQGDYKEKGIGDISADINPNASVFDKQTQSWKLIPKDDKYNELYMKNVINGAANYVSNKQKENLANWILVKNQNNRYEPVRDNPTNQRNFAGNIVGNLKDLYQQSFSGTNLKQSSRADFLRNKRDFEQELQKYLENKAQAEI
jgi:hypothetical protein